MRTTGPTQKIRRQVYERDGWCCVFCGARDSITFQHRKNRAMGGSRDEGINTVANGLTLCLGHNLLAEERPQWARGYGYKVWQWESPLDVPVRYLDGWYQLTPDGARRSVTAPPDTDGAA